MKKTPRSHPLYTASIPISLRIHTYDKSVSSTHSAEKPLCKAQFKLCNQPTCPKDELHAACERMNKNVVSLVKPLDFKSAALGQLDASLRQNAKRRSDVRYEGLHEYYLLTVRIEGIVNG